METATENKTGRTPEDIFDKDATAKFRVTAEAVKEAACDAGRQVEDCLLSIFPPDVTRHLAEAHKEFIRAGQRLGDIMIDKLDKGAQRAEEIHEKARQEKAPPPSSPEHSSA
ncbi:hypothetical protein IT570_03140 [Candidatus Sumerlaeota bacterium]|nr:hypothetical protein [Candidatus Sumerlaeota bacterium]